VRDAEIVETELMLADLESLEKRVDPLVKKTRGNDKDAIALLDLVERILVNLREGIPARSTEVTAAEEKPLRMLQLLTSKPVLYVCNVDEDAAAEGNEYSERVKAFAERTGAASIVVSAKIESEVVQLNEAEERAEFLDALGLEETGLSRLIHAGYGLLGLITFFTAGPKESRAWTLIGGLKAPQAGGVIHTDFERGFICAETIAYDDFIELNGEQGAKEAGKMRQEGRDYTVKDGDVLLLRFNV